MPRREDWQERLHGAVEMARGIPFRYGVHDCCLWAARCIDVMCDTRLTQQVVDRFNYTDKDGADAIIAAAGGLDKLLSSFLGEPVRGTYAAPGDVVLARDAEDAAFVGVIVGHHVIGPGPDGITILPHGSAILCWKV